MNNLKNRARFLREATEKDEESGNFSIRGFKGNSYNDGWDDMNNKLNKLDKVLHTPESEYDDGMITMKKAKILAKQAYIDGGLNTLSDEDLSFEDWWDMVIHLNENILPRPCPKIHCLECGEEVCDNINQKIWHLYNKHNCKPSVNDYKAKAMLKKYFISSLKEGITDDLNVGLPAYDKSTNNKNRTPFKIGMKVNAVEHDGRNGKLIFYCEKDDSIIIEVAPGGGAAITWEGEIKDIIDSTITEIRDDYYEIDLSFDNADNLYMADDTGGEGLEAWIDLRHPLRRKKINENYIFDKACDIYDLYLQGLGKNIEDFVDVVGDDAGMWIDFLEEIPEDNPLYDRAQDIIDQLR